MDLNQAIRKYSSQPLTHQLLTSLLYGYKRPNDKIYSLLKEGVIIPIKKGVYIAGSNLEGGQPEPILLANHILGPSYVSMDTALSYHGLIPERVYEISSATIKASRKFKTPIGFYSYTRLSLPYYSLGIQWTKLADDQYAMIASPEKALFDKMVTTAGIVIRSIKNASDYLLDDLRMDEDNLSGLNIDMMMSWLSYVPKKDSLKMIIKAIERL